jgi:hypothetical protein
MWGALLVVLVGCVEVEPLDIPTLGVMVDVSGAPTATWIGPNGPEEVELCHPAYDRVIGYSIADAVVSIAPTRRLVEVGVPDLADDAYIIPTAGFVSHDDERAAGACGECHDGGVTSSPTAEIEPGGEALIAAQVGVHCVDGEPPEPGIHIRHVPVVSTDASGRDEVVQRVRVILAIE